MWQTSLVQSVSKTVECEDAPCHRESTDLNGFWWDIEKCEMKNWVRKQMSWSESIHCLSYIEVIFKVMTAESKKIHVFYRRSQSPHLTQIHCSNRMTPGLNQGLGGFDRWEFPLLPQEDQSSSKHTPRTAVHAGGSQYWPARGPHCYWDPVIQRPCNAFVTSYPILTLMVGHFLPAHNPHWRLRVDTGAYRSTIQLPLLRMGLQGRTLAVLRKFRVNWAERGETNMFRKYQKKMAVLFFFSLF